MTFKEFIHLEDNQSAAGIFTNPGIPGNPALGGKKPSDGNGKNPYLVNQPAAAAAPAQPKMMKKKMRKQ